MKRIDRDTVQRVLDAADIVEVVSDFVSLKKRGANYVGLCPFHNERTPSFSVSRAKGICKCFSCGKGGSPVNFVMEHEQMSFAEAIRYLAAKYGIPVAEAEMTQEERQRQSDRENMLAVNDFAMRHYQRTMAQTADGRDIGMAYFRHRGVSEQMVERFHLGYALQRGDLRQAALDHGYSERYLMETGLCLQGERGVYDRFRGRVIYPVHTVSGKVVAFGARTLRTDKTVAKYVNSPESPVYQKRRELYGLYQAKQAVNRLDKCILVEGYMDVISMHQAGVENVVASSGTSLTVEQIAAIRRFTRNITVIYDADAAGVKASLRSVDMLLQAGMNVKILRLPEGEDPDSFAQKNPSSVVERYLAEHEEDFIAFKTGVLLRDAHGDPVKRAGAIQDIVRSIAAIPDLITRNVYIQQCGAQFSMDDKVIQAEVARARGKAVTAPAPEERGPATPPPPQPDAKAAPPSGGDLRPYEADLVRLAVRYAMASMGDGGDGQAVSVLDYVQGELDADGIALQSPDLKALLKTARAVAADRYPAALEREQARLLAERQREFDAGVSEIAHQSGDVASIELAERQLTQRLDQDYVRYLGEFAAGYVARILMSWPEDTLRRLATEMCADTHQLSRIYTRFGTVESEQERLGELVPRALYGLKYALLTRQIAQLREELRSARGPEVMELMRQIQEKEQIRRQFTPLMGDRVLAP